MLVDVLWILAGLVGLAVGGEFLVRGAVAVALRLHITPAVVGLTVVAAGTSMPELVVSVMASLRGNPDVAIGNVLGSNIFNLGFVLGTCALIVPLPATRSAARIEYPFLVAVTLGSIVVMLGGINRVEGAMLLGLLVAFLWFMIRRARRDPEARAEAQALLDAEGPSSGARFLLDIAFLVGGFVALRYGAAWVVEGATSIAASMGVSQRVIGLTVVAMGTSLPEFASSLVAAARGRTDLAVGNIVGSNIFNLLGILGVGALIRPMVISGEFLRGDVWWVLAFTLVLVPVLYVGARRVDRWQAMILAVMFIGYLAWVVRTA